MTLPLPAEPDPAAVRAAVAHLAAVRAERDDAARIIALIRMHGPDGGERRKLFLRRREIELQTAETRLQLWSDELRQAEAAVRRLGVRP